MMVSKSVVALGLVVALGAGVAHATSALTGRQEIFKGWGDTTRPIVGMLKGEAPFELAKAQAALAAYADGAAKLPSLFPDDSKTGKTQASPKIWAEKAKFEAGFTRLSDAAKAAQAAIVDEASFKANFGKVLGNCKACHDDYRVEK
jgi:cytochrome c556